jgi:hypothetical protein
VEKAAKIMVDCVVKICDCMQDQDLDEILKIITEVVPSDELAGQQSQSRARAYFIPSRPGLPAACLPSRFN